MSKETRARFTCEACGETADISKVYTTAPHGWRCLTWNGGYSGDESREAHYCQTCAPRVLEALDVLLKFTNHG